MLSDMQLISSTYKICKICQVCLVGPHYVSVFYKHKMDFKQNAFFSKVCKTQPSKIIHFGKGTMHKENQFGITKEKFQDRYFKVENTL